MRCSGLRCREKPRRSWFGVARRFNFQGLGGGTVSCAPKSLLGACFLGLGFRTRGSVFLDVEVALGTPMAFTNCCALFPALTTPHFPNPIHQTPNSEPQPQFREYSRNPRRPIKAVNAMNAVNAVNAINPLNPRNPLDSLNPLNPLNPLDPLNPPSPLKPPTPKPLNP